MKITYAELILVNKWARGKYLLAESKYDKKQLAILIKLTQLRINKLYAKGGN